MKFSKTFGLMTVTNALLDIVGYFDTWPALCSGLNFAEG
jgi:hypothetical protein